MDNKFHFQRGSLIAPISALYPNDAMGQLETGKTPAERASKFAAGPSSSAKLSYL